MTPTFFFSPAKPHKVIWGAGPVFVLPTATSKVLGQGKLSMGPSFVALVQPGHWTIGALVNNAWSVAGSGGRTAVNQMTLQYFINYNLKKGWYLTSSPIITANWKASSGNVWVVPFGGGVGRIMKLGFQPVNLGGEGKSGPKRVQNPPEHPAKRAQTTLRKARRCNTIAYLRKSTGCRFESCPVHHSPVKT